MSRLYNDRRCTEYFQDLLDLIHNDMIVVLSKEKGRTKSDDLLKEIERLHQRLDQPNYGKWPSGRKEKTYPQPEAVETELNENATGRFKGIHNHLGEFGGHIQKGKTQAQMEQVK